MQITAHETRGTWCAGRMDLSSLQGKCISTAASLAADRCRWQIEQGRTGQPVPHQELPL